MAAISNGEGKCIFLPGCIMGSLMTTPSLPPPHLIQSSEELITLVQRLEACDRIAVDTESNSLFAYQERVCLIQFSIPGHDALVDPLAIDDLSSLAPIFSSPRIEKILHAAEYDVMCLKRDFDFEFDALFDTYHAARILGWKKPGLGNILEDAFGVKLNKRYQRANWGKRPLEPEMLDYARFDTHYLISLRDRLAEELQAGGHWEEAQELFQLLNQTPPATSSYDPQGFWSIGNAHRLNGKNAAILRELYLWREEEAARQDRPPFKIVGDKGLLAVLEANPVSLDQIEAIDKLSKRQVQRYGQALLEATARGRHAPKPHQTRTRRVDQATRDRYESLRKWRKETAKRRQIESDVVLPRDFLWEIARKKPSNLAALREILAPLPWRFEAYGEAILETLRS
jgi:ribonuclease D